MDTFLVELFEGIQPIEAQRLMLTWAIFICLSKTSQIIFDLHPGFSHMEDEKGNKLHLFKKFFKTEIKIQRSETAIEY